MSDSVPEGWKVKTVKELCENVIDYRGKSPPKASSGIPLITAKNIRMGYVDPEPKEFIHKSKFKDWMIRGIPDVGDGVPDAPGTYDAATGQITISTASSTINTFIGIPDINNGITQTGSLNTANIRLDFKDGSGYGDTWTIDINTDGFIDHDIPCDAIEIPVDGSSTMISSIGATGSYYEVAPPALGCNNPGGWCEGSANASVWAKFTVEDDIR